MGGEEEGGELSCCRGVIMKQIKFRSRTERVLRTTYVVMYAFRSKTELVPVFQSTGTLVPFGILAESGRNVPPSSLCNTSKIYMYDEYDWRVMSEKLHKKHKQHDIQYHHGVGATHPSSSVDLMNPNRLKGGRPCACSFQGRRWGDLIDSIN